jgi:hypothetical protein
MSPASTMKLVTTFAGLELLRPEYRWKTEAYADGTIAGGVLEGNLVLKGYGDPKITIEQFQELIARLRATGLSTIRGDLIVDRSYFAPVPYDPGAFDAEPLRPYNVGPDALLVNFKSVRFAFAPNAAGNVVEVRTEPAPHVVVHGAPPWSKGCAATGRRPDRRIRCLRRWRRRQLAASIRSPVVSANGSSRCSTPRITCSAPCPPWADSGGSFAGTCTKAVRRGMRWQSRPGSPPFTTPRDINSCRTT